MRVGITTTIPVEVVIAGGHEPVDLNNLFINSPERERLILSAERDGFPQNICTWIKGIYGAVKEYGIENVICVISGDCSNTIMLMEVLRMKGVNVIPFSYPPEPDPEILRRSIISLSKALGTDIREAERVRDKLWEIRKDLIKLDDMTVEGKITGFENHFWLVSSSDFRGNPYEFHNSLSSFLSEAEGREPKSGMEIGYIGVPPVFAKDLYSFIEAKGGRVVFNEIQRQFSMPFEANSLEEQYSLYTYPYSIWMRIEDIKREIKRRNIKGLIHYVQAFCHRAIGDIVIRGEIKIPILTLEGGDDFYLDEHKRTRIEAFMDILERIKVKGGEA